MNQRNFLKFKNFKKRMEQIRKMQLQRIGKKNTNVFEKVGMVEAMEKVCFRLKVFKAYSHMTRRRLRTEHDYIIVYIARSNTGVMTIHLKPLTQFPLSGVCYSLSYLSYLTVVCSYCYAVRRSSSLTKKI